MLKEGKPVTLLFGARLVERTNTVVLHALCGRG